jgi:hypothetical protein
VLLRSLAMVVILLLLVESDSLANCGNPVASTPLQGVFHFVPLDDKCESTDDFGYSLTTTSTDAAPLFSIQMTSGAKCAWNIATVSKDRIALIAQVTEDLFGTTVSAAPDGTYWFISDNRYVNVTATDAKHPTYVQPFTTSYLPTAIGTTSKGDVYSIERHNSNAQENDLRLVTIADGTSVRIPLRGWNENLIRASNGRLYFRLFEHWHCHIFEITDSGKLIDKVPCMWENGHGIAVDNTDSIWQATMLGIEQRTRSGLTRYVGPVEPVPSTILNSAALEPRVIIADQRGTVWFVYKKLWRLDSHGVLTSKEFPFGRYPSAMVETADGTLWFPGKDADGKDALVHFNPTVR